MMAIPPLHSLAIFGLVVSFLPLSFLLPQVFRIENYYIAYDSPLMPRYGQIAVTAIIVLLSDVLRFKPFLALGAIASIVYVVFVLILHYQQSKLYVDIALIAQGVSTGCLVAYYALALRFATKVTTSSSATGFNQLSENHEDAGAVVGEASATAQGRRLQVASSVALCATTAGAALAGIIATTHSMDFPMTSGEVTPYEPFVWGTLATGVVALLIGLILVPLPSRSVTGQGGFAIVSQFVQCASNLSTVGWGLVLTFSLIASMVKDYWEHWLWFDVYYTSHHLQRDESAVLVAMTAKAIGALLPILFNRLIFSNNNNQNRSSSRIASVLVAFSLALCGLLFAIESSDLIDDSTFAKYTVGVFESLLLGFAISMSLAQLGGAITRTMKIRSAEDFGLWVGLCFLLASVGTQAYLGTLGDDYNMPRFTAGIAFGGCAACILPFISRQKDNQVLQGNAALIASMVPSASPYYV